MLTRSSSIPSCSAMCVCICGKNGFTFGCSARMITCMLMSVMECGRSSFLCSSPRYSMELAPGHVQDVQLFLTREDLGELLEALREFATLTQHFFPKNEEREAVIQTVTTWQRRITRIVAEFEA